MSLLSFEEYCQHFVKLLRMEPDSLPIFELLVVIELLLYNRIGYAAFVDGRCEVQMAQHIFEVLQGVKETMILIVYYAAFWTTSSCGFVSAC